jgi:ATP-dependent Lon protease
VLPLATRVLFPHEVATLEVRSALETRPLERIHALDPRLIVVPTREATEPLRPDDLPSIGTLARLVQLTRLPDGSARIVLQGLRRTRLSEIECADECFFARFSAPESVPPSVDAPLLLDALVAGCRALSELDPSFPSELAGRAAMHRGDPGRAADLLAAETGLELREQTLLLFHADPRDRLLRLQTHVDARLARARAGRAVDQDVARRLRRAVLEERLEALRRELGEPAAGSTELDELARRAQAVELSLPARELFERRLAELHRLPPDSAEARRLKAHAAWILDLPWRAPVEVAPIPFGRVARALAESHIGLAEVKERIAELLAVHRLGGEGRGTVLCFVGPPGTGKSSMARAVAKVLARPFLPIPLGAITQEREIVGIPSSLEGAGSGAVLSGLHRSGTRDPVVLLDEIDRVSLGNGGTAAGALLSLLDPEQNAEFLDQYLGVPFDLSRCLFLATATETDSIPATLLDRMEVIAFDGYTESEKLAIARTHLLPRARAHAGLESDDLRVTPAALRALVREYTEEPGVRQLQRGIEALARKAAVRVAGGRPGLHVGRSDLEWLLGPRTVEVGQRRGRPAIGTATGLAWSSAGGTLLPIEALAMPGSGRLYLTGHLGEILRESVQAAISFVRTRFERLGIQQDLLDVIDLHLHFPAAAIPKDGPSAGVAIATALISLLTRRPARNDVAMTGEMSLSGNLLPVGGLREKLLAAKRCGIREVVVPGRNARDVERLGADIRADLVIHLVELAERAIEIGLEPRPEVSSLVGPRRASSGRRSGNVA